MDRTARVAACHVAAVSASLRKMLQLSYQYIFAAILYTSKFLLVPPLTPDHKLKACLTGAGVLRSSREAVAPHLVWMIWYGGSRHP